MRRRFPVKVALDNRGGGVGGEIGVDQPVADGGFAGGGGTDDEDLGDGRSLRLGWGEDQSKR